MPARARPPQFEREEGAPPQKRIRASEHALKTAIRAMKESGLTISKVCINGGRIEIHCAGAVDEDTDDDNGGLKDW